MENKTQSYGPTYRAGCVTDVCSLFFFSPSLPHSRSVKCLRSMTYMSSKGHTFARGPPRSTSSPERGLEVHWRRVAAFQHPTPNASLKKKEKKKSSTFHHHHHRHQYHHHSSKRVFSARSSTAAELGNWQESPLATRLWKLRNTLRHR